MSSSSSLARLRIVAINDVYEITNLPKLQTFLKRIQQQQPNHVHHHSKAADAVVLAGDFLSPSTLSSIDGGRGMIATLRAVGLTHACLGNHEADINLCQLRNRIQDMNHANITLINSNLRQPSLSGQHQDWFTTLTPPYSIIPTACGRVKIALGGFLSDETKVFRGQKFRGDIPISNVLETYQNLYQEILSGRGPEPIADFFIPMTHMSLSRDEELAKVMLQQQQQQQHQQHAQDGCVGLILGGHEHEPFDVKVYDNDNAENNKNSTNDLNSYVRILKSGTEAEHATLVDLTFETYDDNENSEQPQPPTLVDIEADIISMEPYEPSIVVQQIVNQHMKVVSTLDEEIIVHAETLLPPGTPLSSERSRYQQTTVGGILCKAMKDELNVDVAIVNGATIKGGTIYENDQISYAALKKELPFPTKMVVVEMKRWELLEAIHYSRSYTDDGIEVRSIEERESIPRRGYLQVDLDFDSDGVEHTLLEDTLKVALPRNLMGGFCRILPLMELGKRLKEDGLYPGPDDFVPAIQLIIRHFSKSLWLDIVKESFTFDDIDLNGDQVLDREEIKIMMTKFLGHDPPEFVVDDMINAIDEDQNGVIDHGEFSYLLATLEREDIFRKL